MFLFLVLLAALGIGFAIGSPPTGAANGSMSLSIRVGASSQVAAASAVCAEILVGEEFPVDVRVENVQNLMAYELRVTYDSAVLSLEEADYNQFLVSTPPNGAIFPSLFEQETAGSYFLAAAETRGGADSGSGVLARLKMRAIGPGVSEISIQTEPAVYGPRLADSEGRAIADDTGDGIFDGSVLSGTAAVNEDCSGAGGEGPGDGSPGDGSPGDEGPGGGSAGGEGPGDSSADGEEPGTGNGSQTDAGEGDPAPGSGPIGVIDSESGGGNEAGSGGGVDDSDSDGTGQSADTNDNGAGELSEEADVANPGGGFSFGLWWLVLAVVGALAVLATLGLTLKALRAS